MAGLLAVGTLAGRLVRLEPLREDHAEGLAAAAAEDRSSYRYTFVPDGVAAMLQDIRTRQAAEAVSFAQVRIDTGRPVGMTTYLSIRTWPPGPERPGCGVVTSGVTAPRPFAVEIGGTWLAASAQRTGINLEAKLLMLSHAFEAWQVGRVDLKTDARNSRSRAAIAGLGATFEGVLRAWQPSLVAGEEGQLRDTAMYSIVPPEWPSIREGLVRRIDGCRGDESGVRRSS